MGSEAEKIDCPRCHQPLRQERTRFGFVFSCPHCRGVMTGIPFLRQAGYAATQITAIWSAARDTSLPSELNCSHCGKQMRLTRVVGENGLLELDVCCDCQQIWFDCGEQGQLKQDAHVPDNHGITPAPYRVNPDRINREQEAENAAPSNLREYYDGGDDEPPAPQSSSIGIMLARMGLPTEFEVDGHPVGVPWVTAAVALLLLAGNLWLAYCGILDSWIRDYGLIPNNCLRHDGLDWLTALTLQNNLLVLFVGIYFLVMFGPKIESVLGRVRYLLLLLSSGLCGELAWVLVKHSSHKPMAGMVACVMGIAAYYAVTFPENRICWYNPRHDNDWNGGWTNLPIWVVLLIFVVLEIFLLGSLDVEMPLVAHLSGMLPGILLAVWQRCCRSAEESGDEYNRD